MEKEKRFLLNLVVSGMVQGVGFRYFTIYKARDRRIAGWVKNRYDGKVEIEAEGTREDLMRFLRDIRQGPPASHVTHVSEEWQELSARKHTGFSITY